MVSQDRNFPVINSNKDWLEDTKAVMESVDLQESSDNDSEITDNEDISCDANIKDKIGRLFERLSN